MNEITLLIESDGRVSWADACPALDGLPGERVRRRASHVRPCRPAARIAFRLLRAVFGDQGRVAALTRAFKGPWEADMGPSGGPILGSFPTRAEALAAERAWLAQERGL